MNRKRTTRKALGLLLTLTVSAAADQQVIYRPSAMPRVDMHTHMDARNQYAKAVEAMDQWGGTISISLAGLFWVKDNHGSNASPASVRQIPGNDMVYVKEKLDDRILFVVKVHPQTTFIFAHGLFMLENDQGMAKLAGIFDKYPNVFVDVAFTHNMRQPANYTVSKAREFYIKYRDRILFGSDVFAAGAGASGFLNERRVLETDQVTNGLHGGPKLEGVNLPDPVLNHLYYWNAARLIPRVRQVLEARGFRIGYELGNFTFDRLPPDVTVNRLTVVSGQPADLTGTLGSVTERLVVEIVGKVYQGVDNLNGTWKLPGDKLAGLPPGTYDVKVTARNSIGLVRTDSTANELTVAGSSRN